MNVYRNVNKTKYILKGMETVSDLRLDGTTLLT
jgi:hypothetical protein